MATNIDTLLGATTVTVDGSAITISGLSANEMAILTIALCALYKAHGQGGLDALQPLMTKAVRSSTNGTSSVVVTAGAG